MYKGYRLCSHVLAAAEDNGELKMFLEHCGYLFQPNLTVIASEGMPSGSGRKGSRQKRKRKSAQPIEGISLRPCLQSTAKSPATTPNTASKAMPSAQPPSKVFNPFASLCDRTSNVVMAPPTISVTNTTGQVLMGSRMNVNVSTSGTPNPSAASPSCSNPLILKFKTNAIKVCQACRKDFEGDNDTLGLVVARSERRLIFNPVTNTQFWGRESSSHYHCHFHCLKIASQQFEGNDMVVPDQVKAMLTPYQKFYLISCIRVPSSVF